MEKTVRTKLLLAEYRIMEWKAENARKTIQECDDMMTRLQGFSANGHVQGGENHREDLLATCIDRKMGAEEAVNYIRMMNAALSKLDDTERAIVTSYFIDKEGIFPTMRICHVSRSRAYARADDALKHLAKLLF